MSAQTQGSTSGSASESEEGGSSLQLDSVSRGSSVSTGLREEYEDLLRYAVVAPVLDGKLGLVPKQPPTYSQVTTSRAPPTVTTASRGTLQPEMSRVESAESVATSDPHRPHQHIPPPTTTHPGETGSHDQDGGGSEGSHDQSHDSEDLIQAPGVDPEMARLETQLDAWCLDLKRNVLAEFGQSRIRLGERYQAELQQERQRHSYEMGQVQEEVERYKELLATYEQSIARKDHIIASLTRALQKQKERVELQRSFSSWKLKHTDDKRESFTTALARRHYQQRLRSRVWAAWFGMVQGRWKQRVEKACQSKAEEVCVQLTNEYEERLAAVHHSLEESRQEAVHLRAERDLFEENMKKAFMRGVCALNLEAMTMFRQKDHAHPTGYHSDGDVEGHTVYTHGPTDTASASQPVNPGVPNGSIQHTTPGGQQAHTIIPSPQAERQYIPKTIQLTATAVDPPNKAPPQLRGPRNHMRGPKTTHKTTARRNGPSVLVERHTFAD